MNDFELETATTTVNPQQGNMLVWMITQLIKCLPCKHDDLSSDSQNMCENHNKQAKRVGVVLYAYNPSTREAETGAFLGSFTASLA